MHSLYKIVSFKIVAPFTLEIYFNDGLSRTINFKNILKGDIYGILKDLSYFNQVKLDEEVKTLVWPNGADFDPLTLHDWNIYEKAMETMVSS